MMFLKADRAALLLSRAYRPAVSNNARELYKEEKPKSCTRVNVEVAIRALQTKFVSKDVALYTSMSQEQPLPSRWFSTNWTGSRNFGTDREVCHLLKCRASCLHVLFGSITIVRVSAETPEKCDRGTSIVRANFANP